MPLCGGGGGEKNEQRGGEGDETSWHTVSLNSSAHTTPGSYKKGRAPKSYYVHINICTHMYVNV